MTVSDLVYRRALSMLWSAGHDVSRRQRISMQADAWRVAGPKSYSIEDIHTSACELLRQFGYAPDEGAPYDLALPETRTIHTDSPIGGHAVRLTARWSIAPAGTIMITSPRSDGTLKVGRGGHYMDESGNVHLSCGGPSSMLGLNPDCLIRTNEMTRLPFWRFHNLPEAGGGVDFTRPAPIWEWDGNDSDFVSPILQDAETCL